jgi:MoxR-like ATPase
MTFNYRKIFRKEVEIDAEAEERPTAGDRRDGRVYVYNEDIELAVNVAIATARPLLVRGPSGSGKSSLAQNVALKLGWRYYERVISSVTEARDLLWRFDSVRQLADATARNTKQYPPNRYLDPGPLWWAFSPKTAAMRGLDTPDDENVPRAEDPAKGVKSSDRAVVLIDEIDKADPDVPNNLLVPIGSLQFSIDYPERIIRAAEKKPPLLIITTNEERELPSAFIRRCVVTIFEKPSKDKLLDIARAHFGESNTGLFERLADYLFEVAMAKEAKGEIPPSTAEYLDAIAACRRLGIKASEKKNEWRQISRLILEKPQLPEASTRR